ncbi:MAG: hypothetical protein LBC46_02600 [Treponema sp.]|nr:hypothetical protein [Treponema sp.]
MSSWGIEFEYEGTAAGDYIEIVPPLRDRRDKTLYWGHPVVRIVGKKLTTPRLLERLRQTRLEINATRYLL